MAERIERTWNSKTFVFVNCADYTDTDIERILAATDYTIIQLDSSETSVWGANPGNLPRSNFLQVWTCHPGSHTLSDFADDVIATFNASEDFNEYGFSTGRTHVLS